MPLTKVAALAAIALTAGVSSAVASHDGSSYGGGSYGDSGSYSGGSSYRDGGSAKIYASSYINPDTGAATANPDVDPKSNCFTPDRTDTQRLSDTGTTNRNVHNDACFLQEGDSYSSSPRKVDAPATYQSSGAGFISACPDPDNAGPKYSVLSDTNGDGRNDRCFQSGYQEGKGAGDFEFHARMNNSTTAGTQSVVWCHDSNRDGCSDERIKDRITINWVR